jgi:MFS family permease
MTDRRRNAILLAAGMVCLSGMIQLAVALGTVTIVAVTGIKSILGLGPAVFLIAGALAVGPAGRISDRVGRMRVIRAGFVFGIA